MAQRDACPELLLKGEAGREAVEAGPPEASTNWCAEGFGIGEARCGTWLYTTRKSNFWVYQVEEQVPEPGAQLPPVLTVTTVQSTGTKSSTRMNVVALHHNPWT